ncbi:MAG TPA: YbaB/EbfC family nucleoid-associated protein [Candidatus Levybacteria bacterium]|nr:YbaB/EbfC family nucleoid-associated protein [Candidatus Levybacteria bacterium]
MINPLKGLGDLNKLRQEAQKLQNELKKLEVTEERGRAYVVMTGDMKIKELKINGEEMNDVKEALNEALNKVQKKAAAKMQEMGGGLGGLLGGGK